MSPTILIALALTVASPSSAPQSDPATSAQVATPQDPEAALAQARHLEAQGEDALGMGFRTAVRDLREALALRRATQGARHPDVARTLRLLASAYSQRGDPGHAAQLLEEADSILAEAGLARAVADGRRVGYLARDGDYAAIQAMNLPPDPGDDLYGQWDAALIEAMALYQRQAWAEAEPKLTLLVARRDEGSAYSEPFHRFRAMTALFETRQALGMTQEALAAAESLVRAMSGTGTENDFSMELTAREAEAVGRTLAVALLASGTLADHLGAPSRAIPFLEAGLDMRNYWASMDGTARLVAAQMALGRPAAALARAEALYAEGSTPATAAILARVHDLRGQSALAAPLHAEALMALADATVPPDLPAAYVLEGAASHSAAMGRGEEALALRRRAVQDRRQALAGVEEADFLETQVATVRLAVSLTSLATDLSTVHRLGEADAAAGEAVTTLLAQWCPSALTGPQPPGGYGWSPEPRPCLGHPDVAMALAVDAGIEAEQGRPFAAARLYRHAADVVLGHTLSNYRQTIDARAEFVRFVGLHGGFVREAWQATSSAH